MKKEIYLGTSHYFVTTKDKTVYFEESRPILCKRQCFQLSRTLVNSDNNLTPGTWSFDVDRCHGISATDLKNAIGYCEENFGKSFEPYPEGF